MKKKINICLLLLAIITCALGVQAQKEPMSLSLEEATQFAIKNSYALVPTSKDINVAQKKVWETISTGLPQVSGTANYNMFLNLPVSLIPGEFFGGEKGTYMPVKFGQDYNSDFGFSVSQQLFDGSWIVGVSSAELYVNLAKQAHEKAQINIREAIAQAYYAVLISERSRAAMKDNLANTKKLLKETKAYFENGFREEQDVDQLKILLKSAENGLSRSERELNIAKIVLKYAMGYQLDMELNLKDKLDTFVSPLIRKKSESNLDFSKHIDYRMATSNFQVSEKLLKLEKSAYLPKLSTFFNYSRTSYSNNANLFKEKWFPSSLVGFKASIPIFNSGFKRSRVQQARLELEKADSQRKLAALTLQKDYLTASAEMETAIERYQNDKESRELAQKILDKTKIKFKNGMISSAELSQQETQYLNAFQALIGSTMQLLQADLKLKKTAGAL